LSAALSIGNKSPLGQQTGQRERKNSMLTDNKCNQADAEQANAPAGNS